MWKSRVCTIGVAAIAVGCASLGSRLERAQQMSCRAALDEHAQLSREPGYANEAHRQEYEAFMANCMLDQGQPRRALELAAQLKEAGVRARALAVTARAAAALGDVAQAEQALDVLFSVGPVYPEYFLQSVEFRKFATDEWLVRAAMAAWSPDGKLSLEEYLQRLLGRRDVQALSLRVAAADAARRPGEWAVWMGAVRGGRIDRDQKLTVLQAEGLDVRRELKSVDRRITRVKTKWTSIGRYSGTTTLDGWGRSASFSGSSATYGQSTSTPEYETNEVYEESFSPNGLKFVIEYPEVSDAVLQTGTVAVVGQYAGRDADGTPRLRALLVAERQEQLSREAVSDKP